MDKKSKAIEEFQLSILKAIEEYYKKCASENIKRGIAEAKKRKNGNNRNTNNPNKTK
jgi:hypothetical protein